MRILLSTTLIVLATGAALGDDKPTGDLGLMQGKWKTMVGPEKDIPVVLEIKGKSARATFTNREGRQMELKGQIVLAEMASPKTLDWVHFTGPNGEQTEPNLAIYKMDGDVLTICNGGPGNARPIEFKAGEGSPPNLLVFKRIKEESK